MTATPSAVRETAIDALTLRMAAQQASHTAGYTSQPFSICNAYRRGFGVGAKGCAPDPKKIEWGRKSYPAETQAFEAGYAAGRQWLEAVA